MSKKQKDTEAEELNWEIESKLEPGMMRFLAHVIENGLQTGLRTQQDFLRHFSPRDIMMGLADRPDLRANLLVPTTGVRARVAQKKSAESAAEDLQIALDEGETDAEVIVSLFHPDDRVRYLDNGRLWDYIIEPKFWAFERKDGAAVGRATEHIGFILDRAIEDHLVSCRDIVDGISVGTMVKHLPPAELQAVVEKALANGRNGKPFAEQDLMSVVPLTHLVEHVPHMLIWNQVIRPYIAEKIERRSSSDAKGKTTSVHASRAPEPYDSDAPGIAGPISEDAPEDTTEVTF